MLKKMFPLPRTYTTKFFIKVFSLRKMFWTFFSFKYLDNTRVWSLSVECHSQNINKILFWLWAVSTFVINKAHRIHIDLYTYSLQYSIKNLPRNCNVIKKLNLFIDNFSFSITGGGYHYHFVVFILPAVTAA